MNARQVAAASAMVLLGGTGILRSGEAPNEGIATQWKEAQRNFAEGRWDLAEKRAGQVLKVEPANENARKLVQQIEALRVAWNDLEVARAHSATEHPELLFQTKPFTVGVPMEISKRWRDANAAYQAEVRKILDTQ